MRRRPALPPVAGVLIEDAAFPPPASVTRPRPSRTTRRLVLTTLAVCLSSIRTGRGPQRNLMIPPWATARTTARDVQLRAACRGRPSDRDATCRRPAPRAGPGRRPPRTPRRSEPRAPRAPGSRAWPAARSPAGSRVPLPEPVDGGGRPRGRRPVAGHDRDRALGVGEDHLVGEAGEEAVLDHSGEPVQL